MKPNTAKIIPVILSGGSGTRLWPLSRSKLPKQFLRHLDDEQTMFQRTISRIKNIDGLENPIVICNDLHKFLVFEQLEELNILESEIITEPVSRNTAPAITVAALSALLKNENSSEKFVLLVLPSDHLINEIDKFYEAIEIAKIRALEGIIVSFGVVPTEPYTGYGYIEMENQGKKVSPIKSFSEKPQQELANKFFREGHYLWNSGMFMFKPESFIEEIKKYSIEVYNSSKSSLEKSTLENKFRMLDINSFLESPNISIDYALMEKTQKSEVVKLEAFWSDLGSWSAIYGASPKDQNLNVLKGDIVTIDTKNSFISSDSREVAIQGLEDMVVVDTDDVLFISSKKQSHQVGEMVKKFKELNKTSVDLHKKVFRPWGWYKSIEEGNNFQVKIISVKPGSKLSLQSHKHRSEHWIAIKGEAKVTCDENSIVLKENESTFIPLGARHRLENSTTESIEIVEIQIGTYLGEDDIERYEDDYGRS